MKAFTDIQQSKKLAEILPLESADCYWDYDEMQKFHRISWFEDGYNKESQLMLNENNVCAWSLAALLSVIPKHIKDYNVLRIDISENDFAIWYDEIGYGVNNDLPNITMEFAVDACAEMVLKLYELKIL